MRFFIIILLFLPVVSFAGETINSREYKVLKKAYERLENEQYKNCLSTLSSLLETPRPSSYALSYAAQASSALNRFDQAITFLKKGTQLYPEKRNLWHNLGNYQMQAEDFIGAIQTYNKLIAMDREKQSPLYQYHLAFAWYCLKNYEKALASIAKITQGQGAKKHYLLLQVHCQIALEKWEACEATVRKLIRLHPAGAGNWDLLGRIAINRMEYDRAAAALEIKNILQDKQEPDRMLERLYRILSAWNEVARLQEGNSVYQCAKNLFLSGQYQQALDVLATEHAGNMETSYLRGRLLFSLGRNTEAVDSLLKVQKEEHFFLEMKNSKKMNLQEKRQKKDILRAQALLLAGQIYWLDSNWAAARDIFKKLAILPGQEQLGNSLVDCLQFYLDETNAGQALPGVYDPPLVIVRTNDI
jgi:tetratricopeptide (TPR) repeat protein